ncbi:hypothetical protein CRG98_008130, partial [Punica granatum]
DAINSASSIVQRFSGELAEAQRKFMAILAASAGSSMANPLVSQFSDGPFAGFHEMVDLQGVPLLIPMPLSQGVLLTLLWQLGWDISNDASKNLASMTDDNHVRLISDQVYRY